MALGRGGDELGLVAHQLGTVAGVEGLGLGERHARGGTVGGALEGVEQGADELPRGEPAGLDALDGGGGEVGREERVGQLARDDRLRDDATLDRRRGGRLLVGVLLDDRGGAGGHQHVALEGVGLVGHDGLVAEQLEQRGLTGGRLGEDRRDAVEALELLGTLRLGARGVGLDAVALLTHEQADGLEAGAGRHRDAAALDTRLDLAHGAGEDRQEPVVVEVTGASLLARRRACAGPTLASCGQELPPRAARPRDRGGTAEPAPGRAGTAGGRVLRGRAGPGDRPRRPAAT